MKVYIVTSGSYSDYHIDGIFSSRQLAEKFIAKGLLDRAGWSSFNDVEVWEVDKLKAAANFDVYWVGMLLDDGSVVEQHVQSFFGLPYKSKVEQYNIRPPVYKSRPLVRVSSSVSPEHAVKVAAEQRQRWLREPA